MKPTTHFILRIERPLRDCSAGIYIRITFNRRKAVTLAIGKTIPLKKEYQKLNAEEIRKIPINERYDLYCWDKVKERAIKGFGSMETINLHLDSEKKRANDII